MAWRAKTEDRWTREFVPLGGTTAYPYQQRMGSQLDGSLATSPLHAPQRELANEVPLNCQR